MLRTLVAIAAILALAPAASAGTPEAPEIVDPAGDCQFAPANHYADIVAAWIAEETEADFQVHVTLNEWVADPAGTFTGITVQFTHQGIEWGVVALRNVDAWEFSTGHVNIETGVIEGYNETTGSFDASTSTLTMLFPKSLFPHTMDDDKLTGIFAISADLKKDFPLIIASEAAGQRNPVPLTVCDRAETTATYAFTVGAHTMHTPSGSDASNATAENADIGSLGADDEAPAPAAPTRTSRETPAPGILAILAVACFAAMRRTK